MGRLYVRPHGMIVQGLFDVRKRSTAIGKNLALLPNRAGGKWARYTSYTELGVQVGMLHGTILLTLEHIRMIPCFAIAMTRNCSPLGRNPPLCLPHIFISHCAPPVVKNSVLPGLVTCSSALFGHSSHSFQYVPKCTVIALINQLPASPTTHTSRRSCSTTA